MNLYQEEILDHYKHPRNKKRIEHATYSVEAVNPLCGDKLVMDIQVDDGLITDIGFWGEGCAISQASMSMLTEEVAGERIEVLGNITKEKILKMLGVDVGPSRLKCALLCMGLVDRVNRSNYEK